MTDEGQPMLSSVFSRSLNSVVSFHRLQRDGTALWESKILDKIVEPSARVLFLLSCCEAFYSFRFAQTLSLQISAGFVLLFSSKETRL